MTEQQFWHSNPRIIKTWDKAYKAARRRDNEIIHAWIGNYGISALVFAIDHCLNGRKAKTKYIEKPIELFEKTEEEKETEQLRARQAFINWATSRKKKLRKEGENGGPDNR